MGCLSETLSVDSGFLLITHVGILYEMGGWSSLFPNVSCFPGLGGLGVSCYRDLRVVAYLVSAP